METNEWLRIPGRSSATIPMPYGDFLELDEPTHVEYHDGCAVVHNPNRVHQRLIARIPTLSNQVRSAGVVGSLGRDRAGRCVPRANVAHRTCLIPGVVDKVCTARTDHTRGYRAAGQDRTLEHG